MALIKSEVSLIKAMLNREWTNTRIQFYFSTPERAVNSGRISEIKSGTTWFDVEPASQFDLDEYLAQHPLAQASLLNEEKQLEPQSVFASVFTVLDEGLVDVVPDPPENHQNDDEFLINIYAELKQKIMILMGIGHNSLGEIIELIEGLDEVVVEDMEQASITLIWTRGNALRASLKTHDQLAGTDDYMPGKLSALCAEKLRDVVEIFNVFIASDAKGTQLDQLKLGPEDREKHKIALGEINPIITESEGITTDDAYKQLKEQSENALREHEGIDGDQAILLGSRSIQNYLSTLIKTSFWSIKKVLAEDLSEIFKKVRQTGYVYASATIIAAWPPAMQFLVQHAPEIAMFLDAVTANQALTNLLKFIVSFV